MALYNTIFDKESCTWHGPKTILPTYNPRISSGTILLNALALKPNQIGQITEYNDLKLTNNEIRLRTIRTIFKLDEYGMKMNDVAGILVRNSENLAPVVIACVTIGIQLNVLDPFYTNKDIAYKFLIIQPKIVFCDEGNFESIQKVCKDIDIQPIMVIVYGRIIGFPSVEDFFTPNSKEEHYIPPLITDGTKQTAIILCSSGTTGPPKDVCLSHAVILHNVKILPLQSDDVLFNVSLLSRITGIGFLILGTLCSATRVITTKPYSAKLMLDTIEKYRVTCVISAPNQLEEFSALIKSSDLSSLKTYICGGLSTHKSVIKNFYENLPTISPCRLHICYAMTELAGCISMDTVNPRIGSVGKLYANTSVKIIDLNGKLCSVGEEGEIYVKFIYKFLGYFGNEDATRKAVDENGWTRTGDNGYFDADGYLFLSGRDNFKYNRWLIIPSEIEAVIAQHPDVQTVCVVYVEDSSTTRLPTAVIVKKNGATVQEDDIKKLVEDNMADCHRLRGGVYFVDQLPMSSFEKILRWKVREYVKETVSKIKLNQPSI